MDRKEKINIILDRIHSRYRKLFEWLTCEDLGRDLDRIQKNNNIVGYTGGIDAQPSNIVKNSQNLS